MNRLLNLVNAIYDAALAPERWSTTLRAISDSFSAQISGLVVHDLRSDQFPIAVADPRYPTEALDQYVRHYGQDDLLRDECARRPSEILTDEEMVTDGVRRSETYNDFYLRWGMKHFIGCGWVDATRVSSFVIYRGPSNGPFSSDDGRLLSRLVPHLQRAGRVIAELRDASARMESWRLVTDHLETAVVFLDLSGSVTDLNRAAEALLGCSDGLYISGGKLRAANGNETAMLHQAIAGAASVPNLTPSLQVHVTRRSGAPPLVVTAMPHINGGNRASVMVLIRAPTELPIDLPSKLRKIFRVSRAEADIAVMLAKGASLAEIAEQRCTSVNTVRTQVKHLFTKMNARSQSDVVRRVLSSC